jgi:hypothetical protein
MGGNAGGGGNGGRKGGGGGGDSLPDNQQPGEVFRVAAQQQKQAYKENIATIDKLYETAQRSDTATSEQRAALRSQKKEYQKKINALESDYRAKTGLFL